MNIIRNKKRPSIVPVRQTRGLRPIERTVPLKVDTAPKMISPNQAFDSITSAYLRTNGPRGGLYNQLSGAGSMTDKGQFFTFLPFWINSPQFIESVVSQSWVAQRFIDLPIDDMFAKPRVFDNKKFSKIIKDIDLCTIASDSMKLGREYGTGFFWIVTKEASPDTPLNIGAIRKGDVVNCIAIDRNDTSILTRTVNPYDPNFNKPEVYQLRIHNYGYVDVHHSRLYRFDGQKAKSINGWRVHEKDWGVSSLAYVMNEVFNDTAVVEAVTQLTQEASIPVHKVDGLNEILCRGKMPDEPDVDEMMQAINMYKSIYRTMFMDGEDDFTRTSVNFSNIPDLMEKFEERVAMASGLSTTKFLGKSPDGMNATGEGDQRNDSRVTRIRQNKMLTPFYTWIDPILAKGAGTPVPEYILPSLYELTDKEESEMDLNRSRTAKLMVDSGAWSPQEAKDYTATGERPDGNLSSEAERQSVGNGNNKPTDPEGADNREVQKETETVKVRSEK